MAKSSIKLTPTPFSDVVALLKSEALRVIEEPIAADLRMKIVYDFTSSSVSITQAWVSVCGMSCQDIEKFLAEQYDALLRFGIAHQRYQLGVPDEQEYPAGEEPGPDELDETVEIHGLANGFGVKIATQYNFLANRSPAELRDFLENRRIPRAAKYAREMRRVFDQTQAS